MSDLKRPLPQGAPSCRNAIDQNGRSLSVPPALPSGLVLPFCFFILQRTDSSVGIKSSQHDRRHSLNRSLRMRLVRLSATVQLCLSISPCRADLIRFFLVTFHQEWARLFVVTQPNRYWVSCRCISVDVGLRRWSLSELQSIIHTLRMKRAVWYSQSVRKNTPCASAKAARSRMDSSTPFERHTFPLAKWIDTLYLWSSRNNQSDAPPYRFWRTNLVREKSHSPSLTAEIRLDSEASIGNVEHLHFSRKSPLLKSSPSSDNSWLLATVYWRISKHQVVAVPHTDCNFVHTVWKLRPALPCNAG